MEQHDNTYSTRAVEASSGVVPTDPVATPRLTATLTTLQRRGAITIPATLRRTIGLPDDGTLLIVGQADGTLTLRYAPPPAAWFARHDTLIADALDHVATDQVPRRWLNATTLIQAQLFAAGPQRAWFIDAERGFITARVDPVVIAEWLEALPALLPPLGRAAWAFYLQVVLSWTGVALAERDLYLAALAVWGSRSDITWPTAVQYCREEDDATR